MPTMDTSFLSIIFYSLVFSCINGDTVNCPSNSFVVNALVDEQENLSQFLDNFNRTSFDQPNICLNLSLTGGPYELDIVKLMQIKFGAEGGLILMGVTAGAKYPRVHINCVASVYGLENLRQVLQPISNTSLVSLYGLEFSGCPVPIILQEVLTVIVHNCEFRDHEHGALNVFNSANVTVKNCSFLNNTSTSYFTRNPFQGNSAGLSLGYNDKLATLSSVDVLITDCVFINNRADPPLNLFLSTTNLLERAIFSGRGGGLSIPVSALIPVSIVVNNSFFMNNFARNYGGGLYCFIAGTVGNQTYMFGNNTFINNTAAIGSGAFNFGNFGSTAPFSTLHNTIYNCTFKGNHAQKGGCLHMFPSYPGFSGNFIKFISCYFLNNTSTEYGGAIDVSSYNSYENRLHYEPVQFVTCEFNSNFGGRGATVDFTFYSGRFEDVIFINNRGPTVRAIGTTLHFHGNVSFIGNNAEGFDGGAIYMLTFSQLTLSAGAHVEFVDNVGGLGASIVASIGTVLPIFTHNYYNPLCFIQYPDYDIPPVKWDKVYLQFTGNRAIIGSAVYANRLDLCSWYSFDPPYFYTNRSDVLRWPFVSYGDESDLNTNSGHAEQAQSLAVQTPATDFTVNTNSIAAYPGETLHIAISPYDEQRYLTSENFRVLEKSDSNDTLFAFNSTALIINPKDSTFTLKYSMKGAAEITDTMLRRNYSIEVSALSPQSSLKEDKVQYFNLTIKPCPPGHVLLVTDTKNEFECGCDDNDENIVDCVPNEKKIILEEGLWAHYINNGSVNSILEYYYCPPGYCQCRRVDKSSEACNSVYYYNNEDLQCVCDRQGFLCGKCQHDKATSVLLNNCKSCGNANMLLIVALVLVDIALIAAIVIVSIPTPQWLFPLLFYIQVIPIIAQYFPAPFGVAQPYLQYISSATSLYFPYDFCLYSEMTAVVAYSLRYIPFMLAVTVCVILYTANRKFKIATNMRLSWCGLWLLTLLLFTDVVNTSVTVLNCPILQDSSGTKSPRWYVDGTVECFVREHLPLAILAILVLTFCLLIVLFMTAVVFRKIKKHWAFSMAKILQVPFNDDYYWWAPIDLLRRPVFVILTVVLPGNLAPVLLLSMIYVAVFTYIKPYRSFYINVLEVFTLVDIVLQLIIASTKQFENPILKSEGDFKNLTDECGKIVKISEHAAILVPLYYLPVLILIVLFAKVMATKIYTKYKKRYHNHKFVDTDNLTTQLLNSSEPVISSYIEFDEKEHDFVLINKS